MTMTQRRAVAIYARISEDRDGDQLGVRRQLADCRKFAEQRGWTVAEEYVDDDVSAYSGKRRPRYEDMLTDIAERRRDAVIVWHMDRLTRRPIELEHFVQVCGVAGLTDVTTASGDLDLTNGDGLLMARLQAAVAANESHSKSRRIKRKAQEIAEAGLPYGGTTRPFGFLADKRTHNLEEAAILRDLAARALAGESLGSLTTWLQSTGIRTSTGAIWRTGTVRQMLTNPRLWGMRTYHGEVIGKAVWDPILTAEQGERLRRLLLDPARRTTGRAPRRYLLSGLLICGRCGAPMRSKPFHTQRGYACVGGVDHDGCNRVFIRAEALEEFIAAAVLYRLDTPDLARRLTAAPDNDSQANTLAEQIKQDTDALADLSRDFYADHLIDRGEFLAARQAIAPRLEANRRALARLNRNDAIADYIGHGDELRAAWDNLDLTRQAAIIKAVLASATILPVAERGMRRLTPIADRVVPEWRG